MCICVHLSFSYVYIMFEFMTCLSRRLLTAHIWTHTHRQTDRERENISSLELFQKIQDSTTDNAVTVYFLLIDAISQEPNQNYGLSLRSSVLIGLCCTCLSANPEVLKRGNTIKLH